MATVRPASTAFRILVVLIAIIGWGTVSTFVSADGPIPGSAPILTGSFPPAFAAESVPPSEQRPAANYFSYLPLIERNNFKMAVDPQNRHASLDFYLTHYLAYNSSPETKIQWTGNHGSCAPGTTATGFREAVLHRINYFRAMAGVPAEVTFSAESNRKAQAAALMMSVNRQLNHTPPTNWTCYSQDGSDGAGSSNLYLGVYSWDAVTGYMRDPGGGNYFLGHRRWILYPQTREMGTGDVPPVSDYPPANALRVFDSHMWEPRPATREEFVAWPPPGYVPCPVVFARWSFAYAGADFSGTTVSMESNGTGVPVNQASVVNGYGENTLAWIPGGLSDSALWPCPAQDTTYTVRIQNVRIDGQSRNFTYNVIVFNP